MYNIKKSITALTLVGLLFVSATASAHTGKNEMNRGFGFGHFFGKRLADDKFVVSGSVVSTVAGSVTVNVKHSEHATVTTGPLAIALASDATIVGNRNTALALADLQAGDKVVVYGNVSGTALTGTKVFDQSHPAVKAVGKVTAKTDSSVTITNSTTGVSQTVSVDADSKVMINGESVTLADVQVGDAGWVKFRNITGTIFAKFINLFR